MKNYSLIEQVEVTSYADEYNPEKMVVTEFKFKDTISNNNFKLPESDKTPFIYINRLPKGLTTFNANMWLTNLSYLKGISGLKNVDFSKITSLNNAFLILDLEYIEGLEYIDTSNVTDMSWMLFGCSQFTQNNQRFLNLSKWKTFNVTGDMSYMLYGLDKITKIDLSGWNTSSVTDMSNMFAYSSHLIELNLSGWDTSNVTNMTEMFSACTNLTQVDVTNCSADTVNKLKAQLEEDCGGVWNLWNGVLMKGAA